MPQDPYDLEIIIGDQTILGRWIDFVNVLDTEEVASFVAHKNRTPRWTFTAEDTEEEPLLDYLRALAEWFDTGDYDVEWYLLHGADFRLAIPYNAWAMELKIHLVFLAGTFVQNTSQCLKLRRFTVQKVKELLRRELSDNCFNYGAWKYFMNGLAENEDESAVQELIDELVKIGLENLDALPLNLYRDLSPISKMIFAERSIEWFNRIIDASLSRTRPYTFSWTGRKAD